LLLTPAGMLAVACAQSSPAPNAPLLSPDQLDTLVAPIALYPDSLLSQIMAASTYPLEIVELAQWLQQNPGCAARRSWRARATRAGIQAWPR